MLYPQEEEKDFFKALRDEGVLIYEDKDDVEKFRAALFSNGKINSDLVGKDADVIARAAGFDIPVGRKKLWV